MICDGARCWCYAKIVRDTCKEIGFVCDDVELDPNHCKVLVNTDYMPKLTVDLSTVLQDKKTWKLLLAYEGLWISARAERRTRP